MDGWTGVKYSLFYHPAYLPKCLNFEFICLIKVHNSEHKYNSVNQLKKTLILYTAQ